MVRSQSCVIPSSGTRAQSPVLWWGFRLIRQKRQTAKDYVALNVLLCKPAGADQGTVCVAQQLLLQQAVAMQAQGLKVCPNSLIGAIRHSQDLCPSRGLQKAPRVALVSVSS